MRDGVDDQFSLSGYSLGQNKKNKTLFQATAQ
jgi:hypothetical protein